MKLSTGKHARPRRTFCYGPHGTGKSTLAGQFRKAGADAPDVVFLPTEEGLNDINTAQLTEHFDAEGNPLPLKSFDELLQAIQWLGENDHSFGHVAIDSMDWAEQLAMAKVLKDHNIQSLNELEFGKGWQLVHGHMEDIVRGLDWLRDTKGMGSILVAHSHPARVNDPSHPSYEQHAPKLRDRTTQMLCEWADEVLFAHFKMHTVEHDGPFGRKEVKPVGTSERVLCCWERPGSTGKNRLNLPEELPLSWEAYQPFYHGEKTQ